MKKIAYQGGPGAYSTIAAQRYFTGSPIQLIGHDTFERVLHALETGVCDFAVLPVENSITGKIQDYPVKQFTAIGDVAIRIEHCLLGIPGAAMSEIKQAYSHPQALAQCKHYLSSHHLDAIPYVDTALAAQKIAQDAKFTQAAIASAEASNLYGLEMIARDIADQGDNHTRFVILQRNRRES